MVDIRLIKDEQSSMAIITDLSGGELINQCTFKSHFGMIQKIKDCGSKTCPQSDAYTG